MKQVYSHKAMTHELYIDIEEEIRRHFEAPHTYIETDELNELKITVIGDEDFISELYTDDLKRNLG